MIQSVDEVTRNRYKYESDKRLNSLSNSYFYYTYYMLGKEPDWNEAYFHMGLNEVMCSEDCEIIDYIEKKISGELENCGIKKEKLKNKRLCDLDRECKKTDTCSIDKCLGEINF